MFAGFCLIYPIIRLAIKHDFVPREVLKTEGEARDFKQFPRNLANAKEWKIMFGPSIVFFYNVASHMLC